MPNGSHGGSARSYDYYNDDFDYYNYYNDDFDDDSVGNDGDDYND